MFKFLRFEIGGVSALLWALIFISPYLDFNALYDEIEAGKFIIAFLSSVVFSLPLGNYIHQITDSVFSPYLRKRARILKRSSIAYVEEVLEPECKKFDDKTYQAIFLLSQVLSFSIEKNDVKNSETKKIHNLDVEVIRENIRNRYSYFYARIENGLIAPIVGACLASFVYWIGISSGLNCIKPNSSICLFYILVISVFVCVAMLWRIPQLFKELDDIEKALVHMHRETIKALIA